MSLFSNILEKLGLKHAADQPASTKPAAAGTHTTPQAGLRPQAPRQNAPGQAPIPKVELKPPMSPQAAPGKPSAPQAGPNAHASLPYLPDQHPAPSVKPVPSGAPSPIPLVDVVGKLEHLAAANPSKLDWKVSIVDLLKLLGIDSSYAARKELAIELGCPADKMSDSAQMNTWLHKTVLQKIAENGGNIPKEFLD
jgi:hypothetical protein